MLEQKKFTPKPGLTGAFMSILLIVSFFLPRIWENNSTVESINTLLILIIMCIEVHLVRTTSSLFCEHVWENIGFTVLWMLPVFNLLITAAQFVWGSMAFMTHPVFVTLLIIFSLPAFCCYFFTVICIFCKRDKRLIISTIILDVVGIIYLLIRLADKVFLPVLQNEGTEIAVLAESSVSFSPWCSLIIYILSFISFIICAKVFNETSETRYKGK